MLQHTNNPIKINVSSEERLGIHSSSKGVQRKWKYGNLYIKLNSKIGGYENCEDIAEVLVSYFLKFTNIDNYVKYEPCRIIEDGRDLGIGCYSLNFLSEGETNISFSKLFRHRGIKLEKKLQYDDEVILEISREIGVDLREYLRKVLYLDSIISNTDRHLNNLSVIVNSEGKYREAPIYDNGLSCLMNFSEFSLEENLKEAIESVRPREFFKNYTDMCDCLGNKLIEVRKKDFIMSVKPETKQEIRAFEAIKRGLDVMEGRTWKDARI